MPSPVQNEAKERKRSIKQLIQERTQNSSLKDDLKELCGNKEFFLLCFSLTGLFFVVTGIQYWMPTYLKDVFVLPPDEAAVFFTTTSITAPIFGVIIGGIVTTSLGGYNTIRAQKLQCFFGGLAVLSAIPIPFTNTFGFFAAEIWLVLFFGGAILPPVTGIMLNSVPESKRTSANSIANLCYNLFGYFPAPSFYGMVSSITPTKDSKIPMGCLMYTTIVTVGVLWYGISLKIKNDRAQQTFLAGGGTGSTDVVGLKKRAARKD